MKLILPDPVYLDSYREAVKENKDNNVKESCFANPDQPDLFEKFRNNRLGINLQPGWVKQTSYWLIDNEQFIGEIGIRHELNDFLINYGGHIGYGIRHSKWGQGYGTKMLTLALKEAKKMGLKRVLITCDDDNYGSAKVIENNGGVLENIVENNIYGEIIHTKRYWIDL